MTPADDPNTDTIKRRARIAVIGLGVGFALQLAYIIRVEEPYPAVMMPRFGWAGPNQASSVDIVVPETLVSYADGTQRAFTQAELFPGTPDGHVPGIMSALLSPLGNEQSWRRGPPVSLFPGYHLAPRTRDRPEHIDSLKTWLRQRARVFHPEAPPIRCSVDWYDDRYAYDPRTNPTQSRAGRVLTGTFELDLR